MIICSDLHGRPLYINPDLLERIEVTPDTQLIFVNGKRMYVTESPETIVERVIEYRRRTGPYGTVPVWRNENLPSDENPNKE